VDTSGTCTKLSSSGSPEEGEEAQVMAGCLNNGKGETRASVVNVSLLEKEMLESLVHGRNLPISGIYSFLLM
jgi:hypothetical protein